jgi:hypothetical protein
VWTAVFANIAIGSRAEIRHTTGVTSLPFGAPALAFRWCEKGFRTRNGERPPAVPAILPVADDAPPGGGVTRRLHVLPPHLQARRSLESRTVLPSNAVTDP